MSQENIKTLPSETEENRVLWKLFILNTRYKGAEVFLSDQQRIGKDESTADLVVDDSSVLNEHVEIQVSEQGVLLKPLSDELTVTINHNKIDASTVIPELTPVHIGKLVLMFAPESKAWPDLTNITEVLTKSKQENSEQDSTISTQNKETNVNDKPQKKQQLFTIKTVLGFICTIAAFNLWLYTEATPEPDITTPIPVNTLEKIKKTLNAEQNPHLSVDWNTDKQQLDLSGYVDSNTTKKSIIEKAGSLNIYFTSHIKTMEDVKTAARFILKNLQLDDVTVSSGSKAGSLLFEVKKSKRLIFKKAEQTLQRDIPGLTSWQVKEIMSPLEMLQSLIANSSIKGKLKITGYEDHILLTGKLTRPEKEAFETIKTSFDRQFKSSPHLKLRLTEDKIIERKSVRRTKNKPQLQLKAVHFGSTPYIILHNGQKYLEGSILPRGYKIKNIQSTGIRLSFNNTNLIIPI